MPAAVATQALVGGDVDLSARKGPDWFRFCAALRFNIFSSLLPASVLALQQAGHPVRGESQGEAGRILQHRQRPGFLAARFLEKTWPGRGPDVAIMAIGAGTARFVSLKPGPSTRMLTPPGDFIAQDAGFRESISSIEQDLVEVQGSIFMRQELIKSDPILTEKLVRGT